MASVSESNLRGMRSYSGGTLKRTFTNNSN